MSKKTKMAEYLKRARRGMLGATLKWVDTDPFSESGEIRDTEVTHKNPTQRLVVRDMWARCSSWILNTEFTWLVTLRVIYETAQRGSKIDEIEFRYTCTLRGDKSQTLNDAMESELAASLAGNRAFEDGHKNKGEYQHCEFIAEIVGV